MGRTKRNPNDLSRAQIVELVPVVVKDVFALDNLPLQETSLFYDLDIDSFDMLELMMELEEKTGDLPPSLLDEFDHEVTIKDIVDAVCTYFKLS